VTVQDMSDADLLGVLVGDHPCQDECFVDCRAAAELRRRLAERDRLAEQVAEWRESYDFEVNLRSSTAENAVRLAEQVEKERMRLVACGVAALSNTTATASERLSPDHPYYSASYSDVCGAVDREMALRGQVKQLTEALRLAQVRISECELEYRALAQVRVDDIADLRDKLDATDDDRKVAERDAAELRAALHEIAHGEGGMGEELVVFARKALGEAQDAYFASVEGGQA
jgi:hypothetical protein